MDKIFPSDRSTLSVVPPPHPPPATAEHVRDTLAETLAGLHDGSIDPVHARALTGCAAALLKAIQIADLERRISRLEAISGDHE